MLPVSALPQTGTPPFASFSQGQFAAINNGNLNGIFAIPVMSSPGRGLSLNLSAVYNSQVWAPQFNGAGALAWTPVAGWLLSSVTGQTTFQNQLQTGSCGPHGNGGYIDTYIYNGYVYQDPLGTLHPFNISVKEVYNSCTDGTTYSGTYSGYATDASGFYASISNPAVSLTPTITSKSGVAISTSAMTLTDPNGNVLSGAYVGGSETDWTDSTGRKALKIVTSSTSIKYEFLDPTGAYQTTTVNLSPISVKTNFACTSILEYSATLSLPTTIVLPNNQTYTFTYESTPGYSGYYTGRVQRVTLPTTGYYEYDYTGTHDGTSCTDGSTVGMNQVVSDGTNTATWNYSRTAVATTITTPKLADTPNANDTVYTYNSTGQYTQKKIYKESPGVNVLRTINTTWATNGTPATQVTILEDGSTQSEVDTTYDSNGLLDSVSEYDWGTGARGSLLRTTTYTYQTSTNYTNLNIIDLVISKQVKDVTGTVQYRQDTAYDATAGDNQSCPTGIAQHNDASYECTFYYRGNPTSVTTYLAPTTPANGITKNFTYDFFGNLLSAQLNCCQNKTWGYSSATTTQNYSLPDSVTSGSSLGPTLKTTYAYYLPTGQVNTATDPNGLVTTGSYDYLRRPTQVSQTSGPNVSISYDDVHFTSTSKASIDSSKSVQQIAAVDTLGRPNLTTTEDVSNNVYSKVATTYNLAGRAYQTSNPYTGTSPSYWTTTAFDVLGRPISVTLPDSSVSTTAYATNTTTAQDPAGVQRKSVVDGARRLSTMFEPDPTNSNSLTLQTSYTYNVLNELLQIAQGAQTRTYVYDALGRLNSSTTPEAGTTCLGLYSGGVCQNGYDSFDNLQSMTDARGVITSYGYDTLNRLTGISFNVSGATGVPATSSLGFTYGNDSSCNSAHGAGCIGQLITMTDGVGSENYVYNALEQLTQLQKVIGSSTYTISHAYNLASQLTQITYPSGRVVQQSVDPIGRLCEVAPSTTGCGTAASPFATGFGFNTASQVTGFKYGNGLYASFGFSADRLQLNCLDYSTTNRGTTCTHDATTKFGLSYSYTMAPSNNGLISGITDSVDNGHSATYTYDSLYRLVTAKTTGSAGYPAWGLQEGYDRYGNRNTQSTLAGAGCTAITCPTFSQIASTSTNRLPAPYTYDLSGNMTHDGINTLVYDAQNHVVSSTNASGSGTYTYDGNGQRIKKIGGGNTIVTIFAGAQVLAEYYNGVAPSAPTNEYIYAGSLKIASIQSGTTDYWHNDHLSPRVRTDTSGNVADERGTFPFGETWYSPGSTAPWIFSTYYRDVESNGNDYAQARTYASGLSRFSSPDPIAGSTSDPQSLNRYSYVRNMPVLFTDPFGTCPPTVQNRQPDGSESAESGGGGPSASSEETADPEPQNGQPCGGGNPWYYSVFGGLDGWGGAGGLDGGYNGDDSGFGVGFPIGYGGGIGGAIGIWTPGDSVTAGGVTTYDDGYWTFFSTFGDPGGDLSGAPSNSGGWTINPKDLILNVTRDCFNSSAGQREVTYQLAAQSGTPLNGSYNITEQQSDTSLTPPNPWGQSHNYPDLGEINVFNDNLRPGLYSSQTVKSTQYFLVSPGGLGIAQWVPISRPRQAPSMFNTIVMQGPLSGNPNTVKINGHTAPLCGTT
jgi:RHS repeat-associated protein